MRPLATTAALLLLLAACGGGEEDGPAADGNDTFATATPLTLGAPVTGTIDYSGATIDLSEKDYYRFTVPAGGARVRFQTFDAGGSACDPAAHGVDPHLDVYTGGEAFIQSDDDSAPLVPGFCEDFQLDLSEGAHYVLVRGWAPVPFRYTLKVSLMT